MPTQVVQSHDASRLDGSSCLRPLMQLAILGDVTPSGEFLDMTHVGRLDVELVAQARIRKMIVPINQVSRPQVPTESHHRTAAVAAVLRVLLTAEMACGGPFDRAGAELRPA